MHEQSGGGKRQKKLRIPKICMKLRKLGGILGNHKVLRDDTVDGEDGRVYLRETDIL